MVEKIQKYLLLLVVGLFPFFFLPITQEFYITNKVFFLATGVLLVIILASLHFIVSKKITVHINSLDIGAGLLLLSLLASILISSPNKMEALLSPSFGLIMYASALLLYILISYKQLGSTVLKILSYEAVVLALLRIVFFFNPFGMMSLPTSLQFLKSSVFTPMGSQLDLTIFLGFFVLYFFVDLIFDLKNLAELKVDHIVKQLMFLAIFIAVCIGGYSVYMAQNQVATTGKIANQTVLLAPVQSSWNTALSTLKTGKSALFGVGLDNYVSAFTASKTKSYNTSQFWSTIFGQSRSFFLQVLTESGLFGLISLLILILLALNKLLRHKHSIHSVALLCYIGYFCIIFIFLPPSVIGFILFCLVLAAFSPEKKHYIDLTDYIVPYHIALGLMFIIMSLLASYFILRAYMGEIYFYESIVELSNKDATAIYNAQKKAIQSAPYIERYRISFSQVNLLVANSIISTKNQKLSEKDRTQVTQSIQQAISEAKSVISLNSEKSANWENLGFIYRNIISAVQGANVWAISSYQRAINIDPYNPVLRINLGGVYYSEGKYAEATKAFEQAVSLKSNWANAYYNLAWAYHQNNNDEKAIAAMDNVMKLVVPGSDNYKKAQSDQETFKNSLTENNNPAVPPASQPQSPNLTLPADNMPVIIPQVQLPQDASPLVVTPSK